MPTSDLDMPLLPSAEQIRRREFATVRRGYDPQQVRTYLTSIAKQVETLERELSQLRLEAGSAAARTEQAGAVPAAAAAPAGDPYDALSKRFATLIEMADQEAEKIVGSARDEAERALEEARTEADRIRLDAQANAEQARQEGNDLLERARTESDRVLSGLADRRRELMTHLEQMRSTLISVAEGLAEPLEQTADVDAAEAGADDPTAEAGAEGDQPADPRYEDLWVDTGRESIELPDLAAIDLDFDERDE